MPIISFRNIKMFFFDLDGTVWKWNRLIPGVKEVITRLQKKGRKVYYLSNNAILSRAGLARKLTELGLPTDAKQIINSGYVAAKYFEEKDVDSVYAIGERGLIEELDALGIKVSEEGKHVLVTTDRNFNYWKIKRALDLTKGGAEIFCTGHGRFWPVGDEVYPGEQPIVAAIEAITGKSCTLLGKPSDVFKARLLSDVFLFPEDTLLVGDELSSDVAFGNKCGFKTAVVLTGNTSVEQARAAKGKEKPDAIILDIKELLSGF